MNPTLLWIIFRILFIAILIESFYFRFKRKDLFNRCKDTLFWQLLLGFGMAYNSRDNTDTILNILGISVIIVFCLFVLELIRIRLIKRKDKE